MKIELPSELVAIKETMTETAQRMHAVRDEFGVLRKKHDQLLQDFAMETFNSVGENKLEVIYSPEFNDVGGEYYNACQKYVFEKYGAFLYGVNAYTGQCIGQVMFYQDDDAHTARMRDFIVYSVPYLIPFSEDMQDCYGKKIDEELMGYCLFDLRERTLSEHASFTFVVHPETYEIKIVTCRYSRQTISNAMSLDEGIKYMIDNHWMEHD